MVILKGSMKKIINKTDIPDNVIRKKNNLALEAQRLEEELPSFFEDFCLYLKNSVAQSTRVAYLTDIIIFLHYLIENHHAFGHFSNIDQIELSIFQTLKAKDINEYIGNYCVMYEKNDTLITNEVRSLARKRSTLSVLFKYLFVHEFMPVNLVDGFNPIKLPKVQPDAIKKLEIDEIPKLLHLIDTGEGLTESEKKFWKKTRLRDQAMIVMFITYGLRVSELQQLDLESINFERFEFTIYRKRGKESKMPLNQSVADTLTNYIDNERGQSKDIDHPLFLSLQKKRLTIRAIRDIVKKYTSKVIGGAGYSPHKLRATAASTMIEYGFSIYDVQNVLDHENVTTTQLYSAHKKNAKIDVIRKFEIYNTKENDPENNSSQ